MVGGGSKNRLLAQFTADATGRTVLAGPTEATALGNIAVQMVATGAVGSLADARAIIDRSFPADRYEPRPSAAWDAALERLRSYTGVDGSGRVRPSSRCHQPGRFRDHGEPRCMSAWSREPGVFRVPVSSSAPLTLLSDLWDAQQAASLDADPLELLRYRSNVLGADLRITNFGGGNTSSKIDLPDPLTGQPVRVLAVKGSGGDLRSITSAGFALLYLDKLEQLIDRYRGEAHEDEMVALYPMCAFGPGRVAASIDTPLHAFLPAPTWIICIRTGRSRSRPAPTAAPGSTSSTRATAGTSSGCPGSARDSSWP